MKSLDPLRIPLQGLALIEASAGTGKTYALSTLYLRVLLERGLEVDRILVVTFTQAATEELRDRIRRRLAQALEWLRADGDARRGEDPTLAALLSALPDRGAACSALTDALTRMDEAAIYTIHGFCQRMLQDNAFESGAAFDVEFINDESRLRSRAVEDFWRSRVARSDHRQARWVRAQWSTPQALLHDLKETLSLDDLTVIPSVDEASLKRVREELSEAFDRLKESWRTQGHEVQEILETSPAINRRSYNKNRVVEALQAAEQLTAEATVPAEFPKGFDRLTPTVLQEKGTKPGEQTPTHPFFELCGRLKAGASQADATARALFLNSARNYLREALARRKRDEALLYFDDLLRHLDQALAGAGGDVLAAILRQRFPVALIDEFQDTDPQQYRIFHRIYADRHGCGLFLIGDPKQAIYAFRGADIFTYIQARKDAEREGDLYTLDVNWRSGSRLIEGVNTLFTHTRAPFIYDRYIGYHPVQASAEADRERLCVDGKDPSPLQFWMLEVTEDNRTQRPAGFIRRDAAEEAAAMACAEYIAGLLNRADSGQARLDDRALLPGDIALLVRTHREGDRVQAALRGFGVSSVTLSQESVFESEDAEELARVLAALGAVNDEGRVRAALATGLLGRDAEELELLARDETRWEELLARFQHYRDLWQQQGFMVALQEMIELEGVSARLLRRPDGERRLTNLLQLIELLQLASREHPGLDGLLRWFAEQRGGDEREEAWQLRLESDEGLVKVVTMHKSKGLEYPVVFIPFPWSCFSPRQPTPSFFHDQAGRACLDLGSADQDRHRELQGIEKLAERLRLFYVAVTRAAKLCVICWGRVNGAQDSALAHLLHPDADNQLSEAAVRAAVKALALKAPASIAVVDLPKTTGVSRGSPEAGRERLAPADFGAEIDTAWRLSSYSALVRGADTEQPDYDALAVTQSQAEDIEPVREAVFDLPAGTQAGHFLHELLEILDFSEASGAALETAVRRLLERYGRLGGGSAASDQARDWTSVVMELITNVLDTPLDVAGSLRLRNIAGSDRLAEMEFNFPLTGFDPEGLYDLLASDSKYAASARGLDFEPMRGLMRGFIDLVFRHEGRFYIVDYKSNRLGSRLSAYDRDGMARAIRQHRYDLQYLIYSLALHRFLGRRLPGYDYARHFGGVYYLFLRGMRPGQGANTGVWHDRPGQELIDRLDRYFAGIEEAADA